MPTSTGFRALAVSAAVAALVAGTSGCRSCASSPTGSRETREAGAPASFPAPEPSVDDSRTDLVRHDCRGIEPVVTTCPESHGPSDGLVSAAETLTEIPARHEAPGSAFWDGARAALGAAKDVDAAKLAYAERVHVQNAALYLALSAAHASEATLAGDAARLVRRLAFATKERARGSDAARDVATWLGSPATWRERSKTTPMFHETVFRETRLVRIVRTPSLHANYTQLLAVDVEGRPFLTPVVGSIEIRRGEEHTSPACLGMPSLSRVRCDVAAGLAAVTDLRELPKNHFFRGAPEGRLPCNSCHTAKADDDGMLLGMADVDPGGVVAELARREALLVESVARALRPLWPTSP